jgi:hypothetical protein
MTTATSPYLLSGAERTPSDMRVTSGYPIWNLAAAWIAANYADEAVIEGYHLDPREWAAAKAYYLDHKPIIDARIILNQQPDDDEDMPPMRTAEDFFAWVASRSHE